jgi:hypothetical protein
MLPDPLLAPEGQGSFPKPDPVWLVKIREVLSAPWMQRIMLQNGRAAEGELTGGELWAS